VRNGRSGGAGARDDSRGQGERQAQGGGCEGGRDGEAGTGRDGCYVHIYVYIIMYMYITIHLSVLYLYVHVQCHVQVWFEIDCSISAPIPHFIPIYCSHNQFGH
jgi:hypothetical protein